MYFLGIYKQELWERLDFVEAVPRRGMPFLIMQVLNNSNNDSKDGQQQTRRWL